MGRLVTNAKSSPSCHGIPTSDQDHYVTVDGEKNRTNHIHLPHVLTASNSISQHSVHNSQVFQQVELGIVMSNFWVKNLTFTTAARNYHLQCVANLPSSNEKRRWSSGKSTSRWKW
jgi:hypothetical protein